MISALFGIACLVIGKDKLDRGRGGKMTEDGGWLILMGGGAIFYALTLFVNIVTTWIEGILTDLTSFVNALLPVTLSMPLALLLVVGVMCIVLGIIGIAIFYIEARLQS